MQIKNSFLVVIVCFAMTSGVQASNGGRWDWVTSSLRSMKDSAYRFQQWFSGLRKPTKVAVGVGALTIAGSYLLYKKIKESREKQAFFKEIASKIKEMEEKLKRSDSGFEDNKKRMEKSIEKELKVVTDLLEFSKLSDEQKNIFQKKIEELQKLNYLSEKKMENNEDVPKLIDGSDFENIPVDKAQEVQFKTGDTVQLINGDIIYSDYVDKIGKVIDIDNQERLIFDGDLVIRGKKLIIRLSKDHFKKIKPVTQEPSITINNPVSIKSEIKKKL